MTICIVSFQNSWAFWASMVSSVIILITLGGVLLRTRNSTWWHLVIPLTIILVIISIGVNVKFLGIRDSCEGKWDKHFVKNYGRTITSTDEAREIFREIISSEFSKNRADIAIDNNWLERGLNDTFLSRNNAGQYTLYFGDNCYELHANGELYQYWCGD